MIVCYLPLVGILTLLIAFIAVTKAQDPAVHLRLYRRGNRFANHDAANLTYLTEVLAEVELRYAKAERIVEGNRLGHQWKSRNAGTAADEDLINAVGHIGRWWGLPSSLPRFCCSQISGTTTST